MGEFWLRLKQRKLVQWAVAWVAFAFALLQGVDIVAQRFDWPASVERYLILALVVGFFVVLVLAWYHGERGAQHIGSMEIMILALLLAIGGGLIWRFGGVAQTATTARSPDAAQRNPGAATPDSAAGAAASGLRISVAAQTIPAKSVAVLPFANESGNKDEQFFSDGLSDDLITALSQFAGLKVISRNSAFQFRDSHDSSAKIGNALGVAHLLEGSVQRAGDEVRITATLVNASDGTVIWTQRYDKPYKDLFALQDDITLSVADALKAKLLTTNGAVVQSDRPPSGNLAAYNAFLQGNFYANTLTEADQRKAIDFYQQAIHLDPRYAQAYALIASTWIDLAGNFTLTPEQSHAAYAKARAAVSAALKLEPGLAVAYYAKGWVLSVADFDWAGAASAYQQAARLAPKNAATKSALAGSMATLGHPQQAVALLRQALVLNPLCAGCYDRLARYLPALNQLGAAEQAARKTLEIDPTGYFTRAQLVYIDVLRGDAKSARHDAEQEPAGQWRDMAMAYALQIGGDRKQADAALQKLIETVAGSAAFQIAEIYALRRDPDDMFKWLERARANHDPGITLLLTDVAILRYRDDPRFAAFCKKVGLPDTTDAVAMKWARVAPRLQWLVSLLSLRHSGAIASFIGDRTRNPAFACVGRKNWIPGSVRKQRGRPRNDEFLKSCYPAFRACCASAQATCSRTSGEGSSARALSASITSEVRGALPNATATLREKPS